MLRLLRKRIVHDLWENYRQTSSQLICLEKALAQKGVENMVLDHFAIIDLPGPHSGIRTLSHLFANIGYHEQGRDYLPEKQNDFLWMNEVHSSEMNAAAVLPQVVVADFRLEDLPFEIKKIIEHYAQYTQPLSARHLQILSERVALHDADAFDTLHQIMMRYLSGRDWPLPTLQEFQTVQEYNELLAWVLVFGRKPNHFTLSIHLLNAFSDMSEFQSFIEHTVKLPLNQEGGAIKGGKAKGIAQAATLGLPQIISLADAEVTIPTDFIEFVWRYPCDSHTQTPPVLWKDYFTGFIAQHATHVIESLYAK